MKLLLAFLATQANADCIIAPVARVKGNIAITGTSWGPIWKKLTSCSEEPYVDADEKFVWLPAGAKCEKVFCNLKTGGNVAKYKYFECDASEENKLHVQEWWKSTFTFQANTQDFLCPTVREAGCPWNHEDKEFILPNNADQMDDSANQENAGNLSADDTCGRNGHIGFDFKKMYESASDVDVDGNRYYFQKKKFDSYCNRFIVDKKDATKFSQKQNQKTGTRFTCLCGSKAGTSAIKSMFAEVKDKTVSKMPWFDINCKWVGTNKLFGKQDNPYDGGKKGFCDDGHYAQDENGIWRQESDKSCCNVNGCGDHAVCNQDEVKENAPFNGAGRECVCNPGYKMVDGSCIQADPCLVDNGGCHDDALCTASYDANGIGTAVCACSPGYNGDGFSCVPESCEVANGNCDLNAVCSQNEDGSFNCACKTDQWWHGDGNSCDYKPCENGGCDVNADCAVTQWGKEFTCTCHAGYVNVVPQATHSDVICFHECDVDNGSCSQYATCTPLTNGHLCTCANGFEGDGQTCTCPEGKGIVGLGCYESHPQVQCQANSAWSWETNNCECVANSQATEFGCTCDNGYMSHMTGGPDSTQTACFDIDECNIIAPGPCDSVTQDCFNNDGGYDCVCKIGFEKIDTDGTCEDIDECNAEFPANVACHNQPGSFELSCLPGYEVTDGTDIAIDGCINVDECLTGSHLCNQNCADTEGAYDCSCNDGFELVNQFTCEDINECLDSPCLADEECTNISGSFICDCSAAWKADNSLPCNECKFGYHSCDHNAQCVDQASGYSCECNHGYSDTATDSAFSAHAGNCKQDGEWAPLVEKAFTDGIPDNIRTGIQVETTFGSLWPILPNNELCVSAGKKNWDRNVDGYITLFNSMILDNKDSYKGPNVDDVDFLDQVSFPEPGENAWSWGTWGQWGEWTTTCARKEAGCRAGNKGYQTRERDCMVNGVPACFERCMPVDDEGKYPMDSDKKKYPFTNRVDRVTEPNKDLWWVDPDSGKKVKSYTFEEPFNPYYDGETNWIKTQHAAMYTECRQMGSFLEKDTDQGAHIFPDDLINANEEHEEGMKYLCTHQFRPCDDQVAEWLHDGPNGEVLSGWSEWSQCYAQFLPDTASQEDKDEQKCRTSGHKDGNFAYPFVLDTHHYQQRTRRCSTGCFADCTQNQDHTNSFDNFKESGMGFTSIFMAWEKIGDPVLSNAQAAGVNWRACHHEQLAYGCTTDEFGGWKSHVTLGNKCHTPAEGVTGEAKLKKTENLKNMNGLLKKGTICTDVYSSMNPIDNAPYWDTNSWPTGKDKKVDIECVCPGGCNSCNWQIISPPNVLGVPDELPVVSHKNGYLKDYSFAPGIKHKWDYRHDEIMAKGIRFWDAGEFPHLWQADPQGDYLCVSQKNFQKKQFGYMWDSSYHYSLYKPEHTEWYNWSQYMCRYALRFTSKTYQYFTETDFEVFQVEDKSSLSWVDANKFMVGDFDTEQIVTAADNDGGDKDGDVTYDGELSNWRIQGACRIVLRCTSKMVKQFDQGKIEIPCMNEGDVYDVKQGSVRMYTHGSYYDGANNATAPQFCCKEAQFLHWAEPYLNGYGTLEEGTRTIAYNPFDDSRSLTPMEQILAQSERKVHADKSLSEGVVDNSKRECNSDNIQILSVNTRKTQTYWSQWSECSVSCGIQDAEGNWTGGVRTRKRSDIVQNFVEGRGLRRPNYVNEQTESEECNAGPCQMTHWGEWGEFGGCSKQKDKNNEKWRKRKRVCWFQGAPYSEWKSANKELSKKIVTFEDEHCPKDDDTDMECCCEEQDCIDNNGNSLCN